MSDFSGYSTASKYALAQKDAELDSMKSKMEEMAKTINEMQKSTATTNATRGRGRGRGQGNSARGSTGGAKGHGVSKPNNEDFLVTTESNQSKKRINNSPKTSTKFWAGDDSEEELEEGGSDPRKEENWKIQKRNGFMKDRENKIHFLKEAKVSKTKKRNSKEPLIPVENEALSENVGLDNGVQPPNLNLNASKVLNWSSLFSEDRRSGASDVAMEISGDGKDQNQIKSHECPAIQSNHLPNNVGTTPVELNHTRQANDSEGLDIITITNEGAMRQEIEIELLSCNGENFSGSITMQEAKHGIFRDCLGFKDFKNFDGTRISYKGIRIVAFKFKEAIDVDKLIDVQYFDYKRRVKRNNTTADQIIKCKIKGLRSEALKEHLDRKITEKTATNDGSTLIKITGCEYKITGDRLCEELSHWGVISSKIKEEVFKDPYDNEGTNRTGIYSVRMIIHQDIPEWLPLEGQRVRIQYPLMKKQCNRCFENHLRKDCSKAKVTWHEYIRKFGSDFPEIPDQFYGKWLSISKKTTPKRPIEKDFNLPTSQEEWDQMIQKMGQCGIEEKIAKTMLRQRMTEFQKALKEFNESEDQSNN